MNKVIALILLLASAPAWGAAGFRACSAATGTATSVTMTEPSGAAKGDLLAGLVYVENTDTITPPSGWSNTMPDAAMGVPTAQVQQATTAGQAFKSYIYWRVRDNTAPSYLFSWTTSSFFSYDVCAFSSVCADPILWGKGSVRDDTTAATFPAVTGGATTEASLLAWFGTAFQTATAGAPPTSWTERVDAATNDQEMATLAQSSAGSVGSVSGASYTGSNGTAAAFIVGIRNLCDGKASDGANGKTGVWRVK